MSGTNVYGMNNPWLYLGNTLSYRPGTYSTYPIYAANESPLYYNTKTYNANQLFANLYFTSPQINASIGTPYSNWYNSYLNNNSGNTGNTNNGGYNNGGYNNGGIYYGGNSYAYPYPQNVNIVNNNYIQGNNNSINNANLVGTTPTTQNSSISTVATPYGAPVTTSTPVVNGNIVGNTNLINTGTQTMIPAQTTSVPMQTTAVPVQTTAVDAYSAPVQTAYTAPVQTTTAPAVDITGNIIGNNSLINGGTTNVVGNNSLINGGDAGTNVIGNNSLLNGTSNSTDIVGNNSLINSEGDGTNIVGNNNLISGDGTNIVGNNSLINNTADATNLVSNNNVIDSTPIATTSAAIPTIDSQIPVAAPVIDATGNIIGNNSLINSNSNSNVIGGNSLINSTNPTTPNVISNNGLINNGTTAAYPTATTYPATVNNSNNLVNQTNPFSTVATTPTVTTIPTAAVPQQLYAPTSTVSILLNSVFSQISTPLTQALQAQPLWSYFTL